MERSTTHGEINSRIHTTATATDESPIQRPKSPKSQTHINTTHRPGIRSDLAPWTETARGASRACSASASPPSGSPARRTPEKKHRTQIRTASGGIKSNPNQPGTPRPESNQRDHPDPNPKGEQPLLPSSWRRARRPPMRAMRRRCSPSRLCGEWRRRTAARLPAGTGSSTRVR